jgi:hypothetical protein
MYLPSFQIQALVGDDEGALNSAALGILLVLVTGLVGAFALHEIIGTEWLFTLLKMKCRCV